LEKFFSLDNQDKGKKVQKKSGKNEKDIKKKCTFAFPKWSGVKIFPRGVRLD